MCSTDTQKIRQAWNMAISFCGQMVPLHVTKSLPNACMPHQNHKKERLTNTVDFQHKQITNPTITHADKVMHGIQQVIREIKKMGGIKNLQEARDLQQLVNGANDYLQNTDLLNTQPVPRVNHNQHSTGSERRSDDRKMKQSLPRVSQPIRSKRQSDNRKMKQSLPRVGQPTTRDKTPHNEGPPASITRSKTTSSTIENAAAIRTKGQPKCIMQRLSKRIEQMENKDTRRWQ